MQHTGWPFRLFTRMCWLDIKPKVAFYYIDLILKCNLCFDVNTTLWTSRMVIWKVVVYVVLSQRRRKGSSHPRGNSLLLVSSPSGIWCNLFVVLSFYAHHAWMQVRPLSALRYLTRETYYFYSGKENSLTYSTKSSKSQSTVQSA